jgi:hypothetical protein
LSRLTTETLSKTYLVKISERCLSIFRIWKHSLVSSPPQQRILKMINIGDDSFQKITYPKFQEVGILKRMERYKILAWGSFKISLKNWYISWRIARILGSNLINQNFKLWNFHRLCKHHPRRILQLFQINKQKLQKNL